MRPRRASSPASTLTARRTTRAARRIPRNSTQMRRAGTGAPAVATGCVARALGFSGTVQALVEPRCARTGRELKTASISGQSG